jgi:serine/threonine protein kinase
MTGTNTTDESEIPLSGGNSNEGIVRVANTVRRTMTPERHSVHRVLSFLHSRGFESCPQFLGIDKQGRETLSYLEGNCSISPVFWRSERYLKSAAKLLRSYHDAVTPYQPRENDQWGYEYPDNSRHEVICHNDFAPYNLIYDEKGFNAIIDFDLAGPGPRIRDIAYAAYWLVPLSFNADDMKPFSINDANNKSLRLHEFCNTYGIHAGNDLLDMVSEVLHYMADEAVMIKSIGEEATRRLKLAGHLEHWNNEALSFDKNRVIIESNIN